ncbi:MAG: hypothetical protein M3004_04265 [Bacteroidota bacterium]|nr:hypothetical protein [Bacteroidota bacterium]
MKKLEQLLSNIEGAMPNNERINLSVSKSSVGWHVEHMLLTINAVINELKKDNMAKYKGTFSIRKLYVFAFEKIPRGKAKAPDIVVPLKFNEETLQTHLANTKSNLQNINTINKHNYFPHPYFGHIKVKPAIKFLAIHTIHHLKIIDDILAN